MLNGNRLREVRKAKGLTQTEIGELIGVGKSAICCYEKETRNPTEVWQLRLFENVILPRCYLGFLLSSFIHFYVVHHNAPVI